MRRNRIIFIKTAFLLIIIFSLVFNISTALEFKSPVVVVPIKGVIDLGLEKFVERAFDEAEKNGAGTILLEINTPGGRIDAAVDISSRILKSPIPVICFITEEATSAGVLIAVSSDVIVMAPGSTIGAAEPRPNEEKYVSYWSSKLRNAAEQTGRDPNLVAAMADADIEIEGVIEKGKILSLTASQAHKLAFVDKVLSNRTEVLEEYGLSNSSVKVIEKTLAEQLASFATNPFISPILLTLGFVGLAIEVFTPGMGIPGALGILSFLMFFGGHLLAGLAGWEVLAFFGLGILFLLIEVFVPGFGIFGILGIAGIIGSIIAASVSVKQAFLSIAVSFVLSIIIVTLFFKYLSKKPSFSRLILTLNQEKDLGYTAPIKKDAILGKQGYAITPLRPAGTVEIENERIDAVSEGEFLPAGTRIEVVKIDSSRIVVKKVK